MSFIKPIELFNLTTKEGNLINPLYDKFDLSKQYNTIYLRIPSGNKYSNFSVSNTQNHHHYFADCPDTAGHSYVRFPEPVIFTFLHMSIHVSPLYI